jgi:2-polyprenyl-3-methyl-5-hydroxy-6-metoxy-1,4-benzoquinol methylase
LFGRPHRCTQRSVDAAGGGRLDRLAGSPAAAFLSHSPSLSSNTMQIAPRADRALNSPAVGTCRLGQRPAAAVHDSVCYGTGVERMAEPDAGICPICQRKAERRFQANGFWIRGCCRCRHSFAEVTAELAPVASLYGDEYFFGGGAGYPNYLAERELLIEHGRWYSRLLQRYMRPRRVLDVGAAAGFILEGLADGGWCVEGLEPNPRLAAYAREHFGFEFTIGTLEALEVETTFDLVTMIQVVAHFRHLRRAFEVAASITRPGGYWLIETWNHRSLTARLLGRYWHEWSPPTVLQWFSPESLTRLSGQCGLRVVSRGRARKCLSVEHAKSLLRAKMGGLHVGGCVAQLLDYALPNQLVIPYPADDVFWMLLQKRR